MLVFIPGSKSAFADLISTSTPTGTESRNANTDYVGILDSTLPTQVLNQNVAFGGVPNGYLFQVGDLVGRDMNASGGSRVWMYELILPTDALGGFTDIQFSALAAERSNNNLEGNDQISWSLFLNNDTTPVATDGPLAGSDWTLFSASLNHAGGVAVTRVRVEFVVTGFNANNEWFATRGTLSANYQAIPEPEAFLPPLLLLTFIALAAFRVRNFA